VAVSGNGARGTHANGAPLRALPAVPIAIAALGLLGLLDLVGGKDVTLADVFTVGPCLAAVAGTWRQVAAITVVALGMTFLLAELDAEIHRETVYSLLAIALVGVIGGMLARRRGQLESRAARSNERARGLANLVDQSDDAIIGLDLAGNVTSWNDGAQRLYGWTAEEAVGRPVSVVEAPERGGEQLSLVERVRDGVRLDHFETVRIARDGSRLDVSESITPILGEDGTVVAASVVGRDVTGRNEMIAQLGDSEARKTAIFESALDAIVTIDHTGVVVDWNPAAERSFGWSSAEAVGRPLADLIIPADQRAAHTAGLARYLETGEGPMLGLRLELVALHREGHEVPVEVTITPVPMMGPPMFTGYLRDVTDQRAAEAERERLDRRLQQSERMDSLGQLAGGIAHDFNNLLAVILNYASLLRRELPDDERPGQDVAAILTAVDRAAALTAQLLTFSSSQPAHPVVVDINSVVSSVVELLQRTLPANVRLVTHLDDSARQVVTDPTRVEQIVMNLAINARDAMPEGGVLTIETVNEDVDQMVTAGDSSLAPGRYLRLAVSDTGLGMDRHVREHAFEPFFTTKPRGQGTGLGLATVYGIVRQMGGDASIYSEPGHGTTIRLHLPAANGVSAEAEMANEPLPQPAGGGECILLVEDEDLLRTSLVRVLEGAGYTVSAVGTAEEALAMVTEDQLHVDLLITDVMLPGMSGPALAQQLRDHGEDLAVLFASGYTQNTLDIDLGSAAGTPYALIEKPFSLDAFLFRVSQVLGQTPRGAPEPG
jgi:PAS domain S-box-containing protein